MALKKAAKKAPAKKAAKKAVAKLPAKKAPAKKVAFKRTVLLGSDAKSRPPAGPPITLPLAADLGDYPAFMAYRNLLEDHFGQVNLFEMGAMRDTPTDVAMSDLFVRPALLTEHINPAEATPDNLSAGLDLLEVLGQQRHLIVLGDPGAGKSTLVNWLAYALVSSRQKRVRQALGNLLALPIVLRNVFHGNLPQQATKPTAAALLHLFLAQPFAAPLQSREDGLVLLHFALAEGRCFLLLDGIDELPNHHRDWLRSAYQDFVWKYPGRSLLTSRVIGYETCPFHQWGERQLSGIDHAISFAGLAVKAVASALLTDPLTAATGEMIDHFTTGRLSKRPEIAVYYTAPFDDARLREFATRWYGLRSYSASKSLDTAEDFLAALQKSPSTHNLRRSPILLTYMAIVFRAGGHLPDGRSDLYGKIAEAFLETIPTRRRLSIPCLRQDAGAWLAHVAFRLQLRRTQNDDKPHNRDEASSAIRILEKDLLSLLKEAMSAHQPSPADPESGQKNDLTPQKLLEYLSARAGLLLPRGKQDGQEAYSFTHLSFQEYFAAQYLNTCLTSYKELHDSNHLPPEIKLTELRKYTEDSRWAETFLLLFEILTLTPGPAIHPATLAGYLYASENNQEPKLNWYLHAKFDKAPLYITGKSEQALVLLCNLINDGYIQLTPLIDSPRHLLLHALANAIVKLEQSRLSHRFFRLNPAVQGFLGLHVAQSQISLFIALCDAASKASAQKLNLSYTQVNDRDLTALKSLTSLEWLSLSGTQVSDVTALKSLTSLQSLDLSGTQVSDMTALKSLTSLETLYLSGTQVSDVTALKSLTSLQTLYLSGTQLSDVAALKSLTSLQKLYLSGTQVSDVTALKSLTSLQTLDLSGTQVSDVTALKSLTSLETLYLDGTQVRDVTPLYGLKDCLKFLFLNGTPAAQDEATMAALRKALPNTGISL